VGVYVFGAEPALAGQAQPGERWRTAGWCRRTTTSTSSANARTVGGCGTWDSRSETRRS